MKSQMLVLAATLALAPLAVAQDHAVPRGGGGGGGSSSGGGGGHPGVGSSSGGSSSSGGGSYSGGGSNSGSSVPPSVAERRHPRAGTGSGSSGGYYPGYPGYPGYYPPGWYGSYWWPYGAYGWYGGYWGYPGWGWGGGTVYHYVQRETGSIRVLVDPAEARVYVDGYYAGVVDDYDGLFQRLNISPGRHEIALKLEGYTTHRMKVYVAPEGTLKLHHDMQKGSGETVEDLAGNVPEREISRERYRERDQELQTDRDPSEDPMAAGSGRLKLSVRPGDASVYIDGAFRGSAREAASLQLPPGRHRVEVVRPGFRTVERDVEITPGESTEITVDLDKTSI
jgi:hypothetical protein